MHYLGHYGISFEVATLNKCSLAEKNDKCEDYKMRKTPHCS